MYTKFPEQYLSFKKQKGDSKHVLTVSTLIMSNAVLLPRIIEEMGLKLALKGVKIERFWLPFWIF